MAELKTRLHAANDTIQSRPLSPDVNAVILITYSNLTAVDNVVTK